MSEQEQNNEFPEKWAKVLKEIPEFKDTADAADVDELKKIIVQSEGNIYTIEKDKSANPRINAAKEIIKEEGQPYRDAIRVQTAKIKYAVFRLSEKGIEIESLDKEEKDED
jgi:hypothetical protein